MQVGTTKDQGLYNKPSAAVLPGALAAGTLPRYNTIEGRIEVSGRRGRNRKQLLDDLKETEIGSTRSPSVENSIWKGLWTCRKTDNRKNE